MILPWKFIHALLGRILMIVNKDTNASTLRVEALVEQDNADRFNHMIIRQVIWCRTNLDKIMWI